MAGKNCVAIGSDLRFGVQFQTLATDYKKVRRARRKKKRGIARCTPPCSPRLTRPLSRPLAQVYKIHDKLYMGLAGLGTDAQTLCVFFDAGRGGKETKTQHA